MIQVNEASLADALRSGVGLHREGHLDKALEVYQGILALAPEHPDARHFLGILRFQQGQFDESLAELREALRLVPDNSGFWSNYGNVLKETGHVDEAVAAYRRALELAPNYADAYCNLGVALRAAKQGKEAVAAFRRGLELDPEHEGILHNLGNLHRALHNLEEAAECFGRVVRSPRVETAVRSHSAESLTIVLVRLGRHDEARRLLEDWLGWEANNPIALHLLAALDSEDLPRASDDYVKRMFDDFARTFDVVLTELEYRAPLLVADWVRERLDPAAQQGLDVLDLGCGTGLSGEHLRPFARRLVGLDLSPGMLARAARKGIYDTLVEAEMAEFLDTPSESFDLIACVDSIIYSGDLVDIARGFRGTLKPGGWVCFTVEKGPGTGYRLQVNGRYQHGLGYVRRVLREAGLEAIETRDVLLRLESGQPVPGLLVAARAPSAAGAP